MRNAPSAGSFPLKNASSMLKTAGCCRKTDACARNWPGSAPDPALKRGVDGAPHKMAAGWAVCFSTAPYGLRSFLSGTPLLVLADNGNSPFSIPLRGKATGDMVELIRFHPLTGEGSLKKRTARSWRSSVWLQRGHRSRRMEKGCTVRGRLMLYFLKSQRNNC